MTFSVAFLVALLLCAYPEIIFSYVLALKYWIFAVILMSLFLINIISTIKRLLYSKWKNIIDLESDGLNWTPGECQALPQAHSSSRTIVDEDAGNDQNAEELQLYRALRRIKVFEYLEPATYQHISKSMSEVALAPGEQLELVQQQALHLLVEGTACIESSFVDFTIPRVIAILPFYFPSLDLLSQSASGQTTPMPLLAVNQISFSFFSSAMGEVQ